MTNAISEYYQFVLDMYAGERQIVGVQDASDELKEIWRQAGWNFVNKPVTSSIYLRRFALNEYQIELTTSNIFMPICIIFNTYADFCTPRFNSKATDPRLLPKGYEAALLLWDNVFNSRKMRMPSAVIVHVASFLLPKECVIDKSLTYQNVFGYYSRPSSALMLTRAKIICFVLSEYMQVVKQGT